MTQKTPPDPTGTPEKEAPVEGRTARRKPDSRRRLLTAARALFVERGYHNTRPQDVSRAADVGHGTFYLHFPDKRACFFAFVDEACSEVDDLVKERLDGVTGLEDRITRVIDVVMDYHRDNPGVLAAALADPGIIDRDMDHSTMLMARWARQWADNLAVQEQAGEIASGYDLEVVGFAIMGMMHQTALALARDEAGRQRMAPTLRRFIIQALKP